MIALAGAATKASRASLATRGNSRMGFFVDWLACSICASRASWLSESPTGFRRNGLFDLGVAESDCGDVGDAIDVNHWSKENSRAIVLRSLENGVKGLSVQHNANAEEVSIYDSERRRAQFWHSRPYSPLRRGGVSTPHCVIASSRCYTGYREAT